MQIYLTSFFNLKYSYHRAVIKLFVTSQIQNILHVTEHLCECMTQIMVYQVKYDFIYIFIRICINHVSL